MKRKGKPLLLLIGAVLLLLAVTTAYATTPVETTGAYEATGNGLFPIRQANGNLILGGPLYFDNTGTNPLYDLDGPSTANVTCMVKGADWTCHGTETFENATLAGKVCDLTFNITVRIDDALGPNEDLQGRWNIVKGSCEGTPIYGSGSIEGGLQSGNYKLEYILASS